MKKFTFLIPVYNDWASLKILLEKIELQLKGQNDEFSIIILNDLSQITDKVLFSFSSYLLHI